MSGIAAALFVVAGAGAAWLLRVSWRTYGPVHPWLILAGWAAIAGAVAMAILLQGAAGLFAAATLISIGALIVVAAGTQIRAARIREPREAALEPSERPSRAWRGWVRGILAGPLGGIAAMGAGLAITVYSPGETQTRLVIGGLLVPVFWAGCMAWTLSDNRLLRATAVLSGLAVVSFSLSILKGLS